MVRRTLIVSNDFPPRQGGIQSFVYELAIRQPSDAVVVYASDYPGSAQFDAQQPFPIIRHPSRLLLPTPAARRRIGEVARHYTVTAGWFGAAAPLGLCAPDLRRAGVHRIVASTHGHEVGWAMIPGAQTILRRIGTHCDVITYLGEYTRSRLAPVLADGVRLEQLAPGVDVETFRPDVDGSAVRRRYDLIARRVVVCVSRLVPRKGQDVLIRALPAVRAQVPDVALLLVGDGPHYRALVRLAEQCAVRDYVVLTGSVPAGELPEHFAAGNVFAMPCRTRRFGMDVEGLGIVYLEASATGLPVVAGRSGGAPDAVRDGQTGYVVDGTDVADVARRLVDLLTDPRISNRMGGAGRAWVEQCWQWDGAAARLRALLDE